MLQSLSSFTLINLPSLSYFRCISQMVAGRIPRPATCFFYKTLHLYWFSCLVLSFFLSLLILSSLLAHSLFQLFSFQGKRSQDLSLGDKEAIQLRVLWVNWIADQKVRYLVTDQAAHLSFMQPSVVKFALYTVTHNYYTVITTSEVCTLCS